MARRRWVPSTRVARRIAARCLRSNNAGNLEMDYQDRIACVDALTGPFVSYNLRRKLAVVWMTYGPSLSELEAQDSPQPEDAPLADALREAG